jgi:tetratricopeptide (TPR) repeat protein
MRPWLAVAVMILCSAANSQAQGMSTGLPNARLWTPADRKDGGQLLAELASARGEVTSNPKSAEAYLALGSALQRLAEDDAAGRALDAALELSPNLAPALHRKGILCVDKQQWPQAEGFFRRAIAASPSFLPARLGLAEVLLRRGNFAAAAQQLHSVLRVDSSSAGAHYGLGLIDLQEGRFEEAVAEFQRTLTQVPAHLQAKTSLAEALMLEGKWSESAAVFAPVAAANPSSAQVAAAYANVLEKAGEKAAAKEQLAHARQLMREEASLLRAEGERNLGIALRNEGNWADAIAAFRRAVQESSGFCEAHDDLGAALWRQQEFDGASAEFEAAVECNPDLSSARNNLGIAMVYHKHDLNQAITQFRAAVVLKPGFALAHLNLGKTLATQAQFAEAEVEFRRTITLAPDTAAAHLALGLLLATPTRKISPEAGAEIREGLRLDPSLKSVLPAEYAAQWICHCYFAN